MNVESIEQSIRALLNRCNRVVITAGSEFDAKKRKNNRVLVSIEDLDVIKNLQELLIFDWNEGSQVLLDNYPKIYLNFLEQGDYLYSVGVCNRAIVIVSDFDDVLDIKEYEKFGEWLEDQGVTAGKHYF